MVLVSLKPRDYLFVAGHMRRAQVMETEAKVRTAIGAGRNPETRTSIADIARKKDMKSPSVLSCRTRKRGMAHTNRKVTKVKILLMLLVMIVLMMLLSLLLDVLRPMINGYLILHVLFICAQIEIGLILWILLLLVVPFWVLIIHHARLKALVLFESRCL